MASRPKEYVGWSNINMLKAIQSVEEKGMKIRRAAELHGVPKSTLQDRISGRVQHGSRPGPISYLTMEEEEELAGFLISCAEIGYPHTVSQVLGLVQKMVDAKGRKEVHVSYGWWQKFCQRHKNVALRTAAPLSMRRAMATDREVLNQYFDILENTLKKNHIFNNPARIFICDETGLPLNPKSAKVACSRGSKTVSCVTGEGKAQITVLACTCATGTPLPPFVIYDRKTLNAGLTTGEVPGTLYGLSSNGWIDRELFLYWFHKLFLTSVPKVRPLILLMDGHSSHYSPDVIRVAAQEQVLLFTLPPNTTHLLQPLDRSCFGPLKSYWKDVCHRFYTQNPGRVVTRYDFSTLFAEAWALAMTQRNILGGFKVTGIYPFNRRVLEQLPNEGHRPSLAEQTGLAYIPMLSQRRPPSPEEDDTEKTSDLERSFSEGDLTRLSRANTPFRRATSIKHFLNTPIPPSKIPTKNAKSCGRVLTSQEFLEALEEKERLKQQALKEKEERKAARLQKQKAKEEAKHLNRKKGNFASLLQTCRLP